MLSFDWVRELLRSSNDRDLSFVVADMEQRERTDSGGTRLDTIVTEIKACSNMCHG